MQIIHKSFFDVIQKSINMTPQDSIMPLKKGYLSSIEMLESGIVVYLAFNKAFLKIMCKHFLSEEQPSEEMLIDMAKELANLTTGRAKVIVQEKGGSFSISTPKYLGIKCIKNYDKGLHFRLKNGRCSIFIRGQ
ncbi:chemotaxis protein CheX [Helicobacter sp. 12S02232-10]|uniref:chemotaxis protein CheX n=1 Tax=Helicobacter sp. 12S02232-10 TaxID=1476197 RepID=UPI000BA6922E|nr:chemotaxis protein CheX [Helicobacter sp. 12S02232-10]PAF48893.1 chemotaxis protein CheX [Helicobacter sp. 12S02232-10]